MALESQEKHASGSGTIPVLAVRNLTKIYLVGQTEVRALRGVSLDVYRNEFVAIMGASGSGKSTFMNLIGCLDQPTSGEYKLLGTSVSHMTAKELATIRNKYLGFVFQGFHLLPRATALNNIALPLLYSGVPKEERDRRAPKALEVVGLGTRLNHTPSQLSGGQQQRVAIARALVNNPLLLLADEPTGNLDSRTSVEIMTLLQDLNRQGLTIVLVTHDHDIAAYAKRRVTFRDGRIVSDEPIATSRSVEVNSSPVQSEEIRDVEPQFGASAEETTILTTNQMIWQPARPLVSKETGQRPVTAPLQKEPLRAASPANSSQQLSQVHRVKISVLQLLILLTLLVTLLTSAGIGMRLWLYTANHFPISAGQQKGNPPATASTVSQTTPTTASASAAYPKLAGSYIGTLHDIPTNMTTNIALTGIQQRQGIITGYFGGLGGNRLFNGLPQHGPFTGAITTTKHIQFVVIDDTGQATFSFDGLLQPDGTTAGTYCSVEIVTGKCSDYGVWSISPT